MSIRFEISLNFLFFWTWYVLMLGSDQLGKISVYFIKLSGVLVANISLLLSLSFCSYYAEGRP